MMPVKPRPASNAAYRPLCAARPACMRLTMAPNWAAISPDDWVPAMPSAWTVCAAVSRNPRAAPAAAENTPTVAPECQPWPICSWPMHMPTRGPISYPATAVVSRSFPLMPGRISAAASSAGSVTAPTCSTPTRCTSSSSNPCTRVPLTRAACGADRRSPAPQTVHPVLVSVSARVSIRMRLHGRSAAYTAQPRLSRISSLMRSITAAGMAS
jgi:hypothetical protein